jgi:hypothetical protein
VLKLTFIINESGEPFYTVSNRDGLVEKYTPEQRGFSQKIEFETVCLLPTYEDQQGVLTATESLFHTVLTVDAKKFAELNGKNPKYTFLRSMASGVFVLDWKQAANRGVTASGPISLFRDDRKSPMPYAKISARNPISKSQAKMILRHLGRTATPDVLQFLNA